MSNTVIKFEQVSKLYRLGTVGTGTLSHDLRRWWITSIRGKEDPYLKIGETNDRSHKGHSDYVYALRDIDFEIQQGDVLGIIGRNGAGKSTLLKLLSRITAPSSGKIYTKGRIASLLEVGTGFHPELTGRENIYMNGTLLGMKKWEVDEQFDAIVDFSGCERYIDTPVKRYSSGMTVRLGFAIAAHLNPEILVVDEVLAVGDAEFQKKAIGKMQNVSQEEGRTVLFVSHNMDSINNLCRNAILLENGLINMRGTAQQVTEYYLSNCNKSTASYYSVDTPHSLTVSQTILCGNSRQQNGIYYFNESVVLQMTIVRGEDYTIDRECVVSIMLRRRGVRICTEDVLLADLNNHHEMVITTELPASLFAPGDYTIGSAIHIPNKEFIERTKALCQFHISDKDTQYLKYNGVDNGCIVINAKTTCTVK